MLGAGTVSARVPACVVHCVNYLISLCPLVCLVIVLFCSMECNYIRLLSLRGEPLGFDRLPQQLNLACGRFGQEADVEEADEPGEETQVLICEAIS